MILAPDVKGLWRFKPTSFWQRRCRTQEAGLMPIPTRGTRQVGVGMMGGGFGRTSSGQVRMEGSESLFGFMSGLSDRSPLGRQVATLSGSLSANDVVFRTNFGLGAEFGCRSSDPCLVCRGKVLQTCRWAKAWVHSLLTMCSSGRNGRVLGSGVIFRFHVGLVRSKSSRLVATPSVSLFVNDVVFRANFGLI